jgi:sensor domain CHASE-containing protein
MYTVKIYNLRIHEISMTIVLEPEIGVPYCAEMPYMDLRAKVEAACNTAHSLEEHGLDLTVSQEDEALAAELTIAYAEDPEKASKKVIDKLPPPALVATHGILTQFGHAVVQDAIQLRHLVTNKLIEETENPDPKVRIKALELLGKISDVGLFAEKSEITVTHKTTDELRESLRSKLTRLTRTEEPIEDAIIIDGEPIDVSAELGLNVSDVGEASPEDAND